MPATGKYGTVKLTPSSLDDPYAHGIGYRSYWFSMLVVFNLKDIPGMSIFVFDGIKEWKNGALNVVDVEIFSKFEKYESYHSYMRGLLRHLQYDLVLEVW